MFFIRPTNTAERNRFPSGPQQACLESGVCCLKRSLVWSMISVVTQQPRGLFELTQLLKQASITSAGRGLQCALHSLPARRKCHRQWLKIATLLWTSPRAPSKCCDSLCGAWLLPAVALSSFCSWRMAVQVWKRVYEYKVKYWNASAALLPSISGFRRKLVGTISDKIKMMSEEIQTSILEMLLINHLARFSSNFWP